MAQEHVAVRLPGCYRARWPTLRSARLILLHDGHLIPAHAQDGVVMGLVARGEPEALPPGRPASRA